jgi:hypothetical protein
LDCGNDAAPHAGDRQGRSNLVESSPTREGTLRERRDAVLPKVEPDDTREAYKSTAAGKHSPLPTDSGADQANYREQQAGNPNNE